MVVIKGPTRQTLYDILSPLGEVRQLSNSEGKIKKPTLVLRKMPSMASASNSLGVYIYWQVMCYVPKHSILALDNLVEQVTNALKANKIELTNRFGEDFYDDEVDAYMTFVEFRAPKSML